MITDYMCRGLLNKAMVQTPMSQQLSRFGIPVDSQLPANSQERLDFLGFVGPMREWVGRRQAVQPIEYLYTVRLKKWEDTVYLPLDWIKNDKTGNVGNTFASLASRQQQWRSKLIANAINVGGSTVCFDNVNYFSASHVWGSQAAQTNLVSFVTGLGPTLVTAYEFAKALTKAYQQMVSLLDDRGEPINEDLTDLVVAVPVVTGSQMAAVAMMAVSLPKLDTGSGSVDNPVFGFKAALNSLTLIASPRLTGNNAELVNVSGNAVPLVFIENSGERLTTVKGAGSDFEHDNDGWEYGIKTVGNVGYGRWSDMIQMQFS